MPIQFEYLVNDGVLYKAQMNAQILIIASCHVEDDNSNIYNPPRFVYKSNDKGVNAKQKNGLISFSSLNPKIIQVIKAQAIVMRKNASTEKIKDIPVKIIKITRQELLEIDFNIEINFIFYTMDVL